MKRGVSVTIIEPCMYAASCPLDEEVWREGRAKDFWIDKGAHS